MWARAILVGVVAILMQEGFFTWDSEAALADYQLSAVAMAKLRKSAFSKTIVVDHDSPNERDIGQSVGEQSRHVPSRVIQSDCRV